MLQICFFGHPRFFLDGTPFKFVAPPRTLPLLACLLLNRDAELRRDSLAFKLWPDSSEEDARTDLRRHLNYLKKALPPAPDDRPWVLADADTVQWNARASFLFDVADFENASTNPDERSAAVDLYSGDLLEILYDDWLFEPRERLRNRFLDCLSALLLESRSRRDFASATAYAQRIMAVDPWRENTLRQLLSVRYEAGDRAGALQAFEEFRKRLNDEMGVEPMPETLALRQSIARNALIPETQLTEPSSSEPVERVVGQLLPFVGRDAELEQLLGMWGRAARGHGGLVLIGGEAGIGKSRLSSEVALRAQAQGARVFVGAASYPESMPYEPLVQAFRSAAPPLASLDIPAVWLGAVAQMIPELRLRFTDLPALPALDSQRERARLFQAMAECIKAFAKPRPLLLVLEDLHWASAATIAAIEYLAQQARYLNVLILGTYREEETVSGGALHDARRNLAHLGFLNQIGLRALSESAIKSLVAQIPEFQGRRENALREAVAQSRGNALFLTEIIHDLIESDAERENVVVPRGVRSVICARVARLSDPAQFISQVASVMGAIFEIDSLTEVSGWSEHEVLDGLEELVRHHVVRETGRRTASTYAFSHHLVQRALYDDVELPVRARWHRRAAHVLERTHRARLGEVAATLARHFDLAGESGEAATYYLQAAHNALALYANDEALRLALRGLELSTITAQRFNLLALCETIYSHQGRREEQADALLQLERIAQPQSPQECECLQRRILLHERLGERDKELACIEALEERAAAAGDPVWNARALHARATYETNTGKLPEAKRSLHAAIEAYSALSDARGEAECLCMLAYVEAFQSKTHGSEAAFAKARAAAEGTGNQALLARTYLTASTAANIVMDYDRCSHLAERALELYVQVGDREGEADACARLGVVAARKFDIATSRAQYARARELYTAIGKKQGLGAVALNSGLMEFMVGRIDRAHAACLYAEEVFRELGDVRGGAVSSINLSMANYHRGDYAAAKDLAQQGFEFAKTLESEPLMAAALANLGVAERELGELCASFEHLNQAIEIRKKLGAITDAHLDLAELALTQIELENTTEACRIADTLMALDPADYAMAWAPQTVPLAAARAYRAVHKKKLARAALELAARLYRDRIANLPDLEGRTAYQNIPFNKELSEAIS